MFDMMIDISPYFTQYHPHYSMWPQDQGHGLYVKVLHKNFRISLFAKCLMDFGHVLYDDSYWSNFCTVPSPSPLYDLKVKFTFEYLCKSFTL